MRMMWGWLMGITMLFSADVMAQNGGNYKQQFMPSSKVEKTEKDKYYRTSESQKEYEVYHNYKNNFKSSDQEELRQLNSYGLTTDCTTRILNEQGFEEDTLVQLPECNLSGRSYKEGNYKSSFPGTSK